MSLERAIALGKQAEIFLSSELGRHIEELARLEVEEASDKLAEVDPYDVKEIMRLQNVIARHISFKQWLYSLVAESDAAYQEYLDAEE